MAANTTMRAMRIADLTIHDATFFTTRKATMMATSTKM